MKRTAIWKFPLAMAAAAALAAVLALPAAAQPDTERWLHVRVDKKTEDGERVRVNIPLSLAEQILPAVTAERLRRGRVHIGRQGKLDDVDLRAILEAVKSAKDGEFVTVEKTSAKKGRETVRVAKQGGYLLVEVRDGDAERVDIRLPMAVVEAMLSAGADELDILAGLRALKAHGDLTIVEVRDGDETVRVWVDSRNTQD
jgi:hypothetical protein